MKCPLVCTTRTQTTTLIDTAASHIVQSTFNRAASHRARTAATHAA
jgi:hypothetical protein